MEASWAEAAVISPAKPLSSHAELSADVSCDWTCVKELGLCAPDTVATMASMALAEQFHVANAAQVQRAQQAHRPPLRIYEH